MRTQIDVEQALFGYLHGHNLVASSIELSPEVVQRLANATDASGPEMHQAFEGACTGLSIPNSEYYAVFRTWSAPEMPRPGCVWSHVLLLRRHDLGLVPDLRILAGAFFRPATPPVFRGYEHSIRLPVGLTERDYGSAVAVDRAALLLEALYGHPDAGVVILADDAWSWEDTIFRLWSQQWTRLRGEFAFSTGSLGDRRLADFPYDLQIAPKQTERLWIRNNAATRILRYPEDALIPSESRSWIDAALADLIDSDSESGLRDFLRIYGNDVSYPRRAYAALVTAKSRFERPLPDDAGEELLTIAKTFAAAGDAASLKRYVLKRISAHAHHKPDVALMVAAFLINAEEASAFQDSYFETSDCAATLWSRKRADLLALLGGPARWPGPLEHMRRAVARAIDGADIPYIWQEQRDLLPQLVRYNVELGIDWRSWLLPHPGQQSLWAALEGTTRDPVVWARIMAAMLSAGAALNESETISLAQERLGESLERWIASDTARTPTDSWRQALRRTLGHKLHADGLSSKVLAIAAWSVPPEDARRIPGWRSDVQALADEDITQLPGEIRNYVLFWLTALGLKTAGTEGLRLLSCSFFSTYESVEHSKYSRECWELIDPELPPALFGWDWDRCKRLRNALRGWLGHNPGMRASLMRAAPTARAAGLVASL